MNPTSDFLIIGGGLAGARGAQALRAEGFEGSITIVGDEHLRPYERPPLSKDYLQGTADIESLFVHPAEWYVHNDVTLQLGSEATTLDRDNHQVLLADGSRLRYDKVLLATGSSPRALHVPGADLIGVFQLRRLDDSDDIRSAFATGPRVVIIGAGWIGLETAAAARAAGLDVTILEVGPLPLMRVLGPEVARMFAELHADHGVDLRFNVEVAALVESAGTVAAVQLGDGTRVPADMVIVGVGITPNTGLAEAAGLEIDNGIVVDEHLQTTDPDVFAAGDVANAFHPFLQRRIRVEHWANAERQPPIAALGMMGRRATYDRLPFFYSDQYDLGLEYTGYAGPDDYDEVVIRGSLPDRRFIAFWLSGGRVLAGMNVNIWDVSDAIGTLIESRRVVDSARLADPDVAVTDV